MNDKAHDKKLVFILISAFYPSCLNFWHLLNSIVRICTTNVDIT